VASLEAQQAIWINHISELYSVLIHTHKYPHASYIAQQHEYEPSRENSARACRNRPLPTFNIAFPMVSYFCRTEAEHPTDRQFLAICTVWHTQYDREAGILGVPAEK